MEVIVRILMYDRGNVEHLPNDLGEDGEDKFQKELVLMMNMHRWRSRLQEIKGRSSKIKNKKVKTLFLKKLEVF